MTYDQPPLELFFFNLFYYYWADSDSDCAQGKGKITREKLQEGNYKREFTRGINYNAMHAQLIYYNQ